MKMVNRFADVILKDTGAVSVMERKYARVVATWDRVAALDGVASSSYRAGTHLSGPTSLTPFSAKSINPLNQISAHFLSQQLFNAYPGADLTGAGLSASGSLLMGDIRPRLCSEVDAVDSGVEN